MMPDRARVESARLATLAVFFINGAVFASWAANIPAVRARLNLNPATLGFVLLLNGISAAAPMLSTSVRLLAAE